MIEKVHIGSKNIITFLRIYKGYEFLLLANNNR